MKIRAIAVPYALGHEDRGSGRGPQRFLDAGVVDALRAHAHDVTLSRIHRQTEFTSEVGASFDVNRQLAPVVREAAAEEAVPLIFSGDCTSCLGTLAGVGHDALGIIWFDAHGDFNTPETTVTGFLGGMPLAAA